MRTNPVKEKLQRGEVVFGCMVVSTDPAVTEVLAMSGFDFLMFDGEHCPFNEKLLEDVVRACELGGAVATARVPVNDPQAMLPFLDTGILGVQAPHCNTRADAVRLVQAVKYAPIGKRGVGGGRVGGYSLVPKAEHIQRWNEMLLAIVQVEEVEGVQNLPEMLTVPGTDVFAIGLADLSTSMGYPGNKEHPEVQKTMTKMCRQIRDAGRWVSVAVEIQPNDDPVLVKRYVDMGVQIIKYGDMRLLSDRAMQVLKAGRNAVQ